MPYRTNDFVQGRYYHVYNRGAGKSKIFFTEDNYRYLLQLIQRHYQKYRINIIAYCLMTNHYHLLLRQESGVPISKFINILFNSYVQALNRQQDRSGTLFEGRFKHICVDEWEYLIHLCRYIHRNSVKAGLVSSPEEWVYSNYREWIGTRNGALFDKSFVTEHFSSVEEYIEFANDIQNEEKSLSKIGKYILD